MNLFGQSSLSIKLFTDQWYDTLLTSINLPQPEMYDYIPPVQKVQVMDSFGVNTDDDEEFEEFLIL